MKGFDFGWFLGVLKAWISISFARAKWGRLSNELSKDRRGLEYLRQLPVSFSSSVVVILETENLNEGPSGDFKSHMKRSFLFLDSKKIQLLQDLWKQRSSMLSFAIKRSILASFFEWGRMPCKSLSKCLWMEVIPLEARRRVRYLFFHSLELGS